MRTEGEAAIRDASAHVHVTFCDPKMSRVCPQLSMPGHLMLDHAISMTSPGAAFIN
jgi:hypothetical protein